MAQTIATYDFPTHERGTTFGGLQFELLVNGIAKSLVGATINMKIGNIVFSTSTGELATPNGGCGANSLATAGSPICAEYGGGAGGVYVISW